MIPLPNDIALTDDFIAQLDACWFAGFAQLSGQHQQTLAQLGSIFAGSPLETPLKNAIQSITQGMYQPEHFQVLALARVALQGAQFERLQEALLKHLNRPLESETSLSPATIEPAQPVVKGAAYWLTDIALRGFSRLETKEIAIIDSTLIQLQNDPALMPLSTLLYGFMDELVGLVPTVDVNTIPLFRWVDLWCASMVMTTHHPPQPNPTPISGELSLMGVEWRVQGRLISAVFYGILTQDEGARWVQTTFSTYKVTAIERDEARLLLPQTRPLLEALKAGTVLRLNQMPYLATGHLLWDEASVSAGGSYKLADVAQTYLAVDAPSPLHSTPVPPEKRHPVHLAIPIFLAGYSLNLVEHTTNEGTITAGELTFPLEDRRVHQTELDPEELAKQAFVIGLLRYDDQQFTFHPIAAANKKGKPIFVGVGETLKLFEKPSNKSTIALLQERASRLLREKNS